MEIGLADDFYLSNIIIVGYCYHYQAVDAVKGINYLNRKKNSIRLRVEQKERTYPIFCLLSLKEQQIW